MAQIIKIAAANSSEANRSAADFVCKGTGDELVITQAIALLETGGTIQLLDGDYNIDSFPFEGHSAIYFGYNNGNARSINFIGDTHNKSYNTHFGAVIHVTERALNTIQPGETYRVFYGTGQKPDAPGVFFKFTFINNVNFSDFFLFFFDASRPLIGIDCSHFGGSLLRRVGVFTEKYFYDRFMHVKPATPTKDCIGILSNASSCDEMAPMRYDTLDTGGLYAGFVFRGVDHLVVNTCNAARCCYGFVFYEGLKTLTMLNCSDEGNTHMPRFYGTGHLTSIDFNVERFNSDYIPEDPEGDTHWMADEEIPGGWHGFISYTLQGKAYCNRTFWAPGSGINVETVNLNHHRCERPENPEFLESYFDRKRNQQITWNGEFWVDPLGNKLED